MAPKGLNDDTVHFISAKKNEPQWLLDWLSLPKAQSGMLSERIADKLRS